MIAAPVVGAPAKKASPKPPAKPSTPPAITPAILGATLKTLGYPARPEGTFQRVQIEEEGKEYGYLLDLSFSKSGEWLVCMAHLAAIPDLTAVKSGPLLTLLSQNEEMVGIYFSYDKVNGRVMLNSAVPAKGLDAAGVKRAVDGMRATVIRTEVLWDAAKW